MTHRDRIDAAAHAAVADGVPASVVALALAGAGARAVGAHDDTASTERVEALASARATEHIRPLADACVGLTPDDAPALAEQVGRWLERGATDADRARTGLWHTPAALARRVVRGAPDATSLVDVAAGAGMFAAAWARSRAADVALTLHLVERGSTSAACAAAVVAMATADRDAQVTVTVGDALTAEITPADQVVSNPPWVALRAMHAGDAEAARAVARSIGLAPKGRWFGGTGLDVSALYLWFAAHRWTRPGGRFDVLAPCGLLEADAAGELRAALVDRLAFVTELPDPTAFGRVAVRWAWFAGTRPTSEMASQASGERTGDEASTATHAGCAGAEAAAAHALVAHADDEPATDLAWSPLGGDLRGPWALGDAADRALRARLFGADGCGPRPRRGVTTDLNGLFFVEVLERDGDLVRVRNDPRAGRKPLDAREAWIEAAHVYPVVRGRDVHRFAARPTPGRAIVVPQRGLRGDPSLADAAPRTHAWLMHEQAALEARSSYRRFQAPRGAPPWSLWNVGPYTWAPWRVAWRELARTRFEAAVLHTAPLAGVPDRPAVADHKLYFVAVDTADEADALAAVLNAPRVARAVFAAASTLSHGGAVIRRLRVPTWDPGAPAWQRLADLGRTARLDDGAVDARFDAALDDAVEALLAGADSRGGAGSATV